MFPYNYTVCWHQNFQNFTTHSGIPSEREGPVVSLPFSPHPYSPNYLTSCFNVIKLTWSCIIQYLFMYSTICLLYSGFPSPKNWLSTYPLLPFFKSTVSHTPSCSIHLSFYLSFFMFPLVPVLGFFMTISFLAFSLCI